MCLLALNYSPTYYHFHYIQTLLMNNFYFTLLFLCKISCIAWITYQINAGICTNCRKIKPDGYTLRVPHTQFLVLFFGLEIDIFLVKREFSLFFFFNCCFSSILLVEIVNNAHKHTDSHTAEKTKMCELVSICDERTYVHRFSPWNFRFQV